MILNPLEDSSMPVTSRRAFLRTTLAAGAALTAWPLRARAAEPSTAGMKLGMVTYLWGRDWDLPTLIAHCEKAELGGVELRTQHAHGVEPSLSMQQRLDVKKRFADSPVVCVGLGTNQCYDSPNPAAVRKAIEGTIDFIKLSHDIGASGVKVKPNDLHPEVPREQTTAQIAGALNEVGKAAADFGQKIRLEVHGSCAPLPIIKEIMDQVESPNVGVCWNSNGEDLKGEGLAANFALVADRLADTVHVRELNAGDYPYQELFRLLAARQYAGWILLECRTDPQDRVAALAEQRRVFHDMLAKI